MVSQEAYEQFMLDSQKAIDDSERNGKRKADKVLNALFDDFNANLFARFVDELNLANLKENADDYDSAYMHRLRAEVYNAVLSLTK